MIGASMLGRALAVSPDVLLMDEPCSALDPTSTNRIEETIAELENQVTIVIVTHNMQQAQRVSRKCAFFLAAEDTRATSWRQGRPRRCSARPRTPGPPTTSTAGSAEPSPGRGSGQVTAAQEGSGAAAPTGLGWACGATSVPGGVR